MKFINVVTEAPTKQAKVLGKVEIFGQLFACVNYPSTYLNAADTIFTRKIVHVKTGMLIPIFNISHKETIKSHLNKAVEFINSIGEAEVNSEINKHQFIN